MLEVRTGSADTVARPRPDRVRRLAPPVLVVALYLAGSLALHHRVLGGFTTTTIGRVTADSDLFMWWLNWTPWALLHGENPLFTTHQHYPLGVNAMWNTGTPLLGLALAPITLTAGPVAAYNTGMILGPVVSGVALAAALGPYVRRWAPRAVAGALYAFGPFHLAHTSAGHLNLVWSVLPPVLLYLVHVLFVRRLERPLRTGALVGVVLAAQTVLYTQTLAFGVLMLVVTAAVLAARWPRRALAALPGLCRAGPACLGVYAVLCAYPLYLILAGPVRPRAPIRDVEFSGADLANAVVPTSLTAFRFTPDGPAERMQGHLGEQGGYLGPAMLALLVVAVVAVRCTALRVAATVGAIAYVFSLGPTLVIFDEHTGVPLPWRVFTGVPLLLEAEPVRLQIVVVLCVAVVVALWLDRLPSMAPRGARVAVAALTAVALLSWLPADRQQTQSAATPAFFATAAQHLRADDVVETYPRLNSWWYGGAEPLRWQVASGMAYRTTGGYFIGSDAVHDVLIESPWNRYQIGAAWIADGKGTPDEGYAADAGAELRSIRATVVIVVPPPDAAAGPILDWTRRVTGSPGERVADAWLFRL
ncbi:hypothetical protein [Pseudonocardia asaccharolytica]|uniref:Glycosyl transferase n=1 Tax=Pseudonocardia asaccharolytica DSM 44247 = NBRC 16224 TaxID=1123024 RepID=A0A511CW77_9PSEU|nr:hypothetical protein [Pseudonocardia asaccharolytica]GEL16493.1 hypothetical protein PA7_03300 [Pseudonocardia asaccharolytica DSM 44247 = NBRC 16224]